MHPLADLDARIDTAIGTMDVESKVRLLTGASNFTLHPDPSIDLAEIVLSDGPTGVRGDRFTGGRIACLLPNATLLAQHWDTGVAADVGALLAEEAQAQRVHVVLGPTVNLHRTPLAGRLFESFSEDPLLTGVLASAYIKGLQDNGIGATIKHFVANESETDRKTANAVVDERTLREIYLLPFEIAVSEANPWAVMAAYNSIGGTPATEHARLLDGVLKGEWGYDGLVMSDWYATYSTAESANAGLDLTMPGPAGPWGDALVDAVRAGAVAESILDDHVRRLLRLAGRVGAFGPERQWTPGGPAPDSPQRRSTLRRLAAGGMTVLVNKGATLPLTGTGTVAVIGRHATETTDQGAGSSQVRPPHVVSIADGIVEAFGPDRVSVVDGVEVRTDPLAAAPHLLRDPETHRYGMRVTTRDERGEVLESRHVDWSEVSLREDSWLDSATTIELSAEIVLPETTRVQVGVRGRGEWTFTTPGHYEQIRLDRVDDAGEVLRLPYRTVTLDLEPGAIITAVATPAPGRPILGLAARVATKPPAVAIGAATKAARQADVAVVVVGLTPEQESEEVDKITLALPGEQDAMVAAVAAAAKRTVVVVNAATPVLMPWLDRVDAVLWAGLPGQEAGDAVAAALSGAIEPAGRLVTTFPARDGEGPAWSPVPDRGEVRYAEGLSVGYRGWSTEPLFWFGHGLGYGDWAYGNAEVIVDDHLRCVRVEVTNVGSRTSREVVQVYWRPEGEPVRLIGWSGIDVAPGATVTVDVPVDRRVLRRWHENGWQLLPLTGEVLIARGLGDVRLTRPALPTIQRSQDVLPA
ncbi:glycoside hydrolase family 3 C-terminal domain-containing protein [Rhodococcus sp. ACS1]|uniref:glycoside hydrolase family 3 protein n=1 Tax=Rhodococcus sp. ACS1 TaxID=2028570 RepID=UPI00211BF5FB|nr:glycoside hydrolase family 3 C-terminal domain-containing protein [Rhodococcus sp. ACS1]